MFDTTKQFCLQGIQVGEGFADVTVRWPSDQELEERARGRKILIKRLGRGITETTIDSLGIDVQVYEAIKLNGAAPLTPAEANKFMDLLLTSDVTDVEIDSNEADVTLTTINGETLHHLRIPTADQVLKLNRSARMLSMPYNVQQLKIGVLAAAEIYDQQHGSSKDYAGAIPANHKDAVVRAVIEHIDMRMAPRDAEKSF